MLLNTLSSNAPRTAPMTVPTPSGNRHASYHGRRNHGQFNPFGCRRIHGSKPCQPERAGQPGNGARNDEPGRQPDDLR